MCTNTAILNTLECYMEDMVDCFEDFVKKSLFIITLTIGGLIGMMLFFMRSSSDRASRTWGGGVSGRNSVTGVATTGNNKSNGLRGERNQGFVSSDGYKSGGGNVSSEGYHADNEGYSSGAQGYASSDKGYASDQKGYSGSQKGYAGASSKQGYESNKQGYANSQRGYTSDQQGYASSQNKEVKSSQGYEEDYSNIHSTKSSRSVTRDINKETESTVLKTSAVQKRSDGRASDAIGNIVCIGGRPCPGPGLSENAIKCLCPSVRVLCPGQKCKKEEKKEKTSPCRTCSRSSSKCCLTSSTCCIPKKSSSSSSSSETGTVLLCPSGQSYKDLSRSCDSTCSIKVPKKPSCPMRIPCLRKSSCSRVGIPSLPTCNLLRPSKCPAQTKSCQKVSNPCSKSPTCTCCHDNL